MTRFLLSVSTIFILLIVNMSGLNAQNPERDINGREVTGSSGEKINYPEPGKSITPASKQPAQFISNLRVSSGDSNISKDTINLKYDILYSVMGTSIGRHSMHSVDIDGDGIQELICTASSTTFGSGNFWYIMKYNPDDQNYHQVFTSNLYETGITSLEVANPKGDDHYRIFLGMSDGSLQVYDAVSGMLLSTNRPSTRQINSIVCADANNDGKKDIVISGPENCYILNADVLNVVYTIDKGANDIRVGNVDALPGNEIVLSSGSVLFLNDSTLNNVWNFSSSHEGTIELSDIDNDSIEEIIYAEAWYYIHAYDVDAGTTKFTITTDLDINSLLLADVNADGRDEIIYGDGQWGSIHCHDAVTQQELWSVDNPEHGVAAINFADLDQDGVKELIWSAGFTSTGPDYLYIYNVGNSVLKWRSDDVVGPFYAIESGDVDGDGKAEVVAVSFESESGYGSGIIFIIDPVTQRIKWRSGSNFLEQIWTGVYNVDIYDIDKDGLNEIIIAAGRTYTGEIWIIDGKNHSIKSSHVFSTEGISEFYEMRVSDVDDDGTAEIVAISDNHIYVIDPVTWVVEWDVEVRGGSSQPVIRIADINDDGKKEIITCKGTLNIINSSDHSVWNSNENDYLNIDIFDCNRDDIPDIVASTSSGKIRIIDGKTRTIRNEINAEPSPISSVRVIRFADSLLFIYSSSGRINYYQNDENRLVSQNFGNSAAKVEGLKLMDLQDTSDLLFGTGISVFRIPGNTYSCIGMRIGIETNEVSCDKNDGFIRFNVTGGSPPYSFQWPDNLQPDSLTWLQPGKYRVTISDTNGCIKERTISLERAYIDAGIQTSMEGCSTKGAVHINLNHINSPYTIEWSDGFNGTENTGLDAGIYHVVIRDSLGCVFEANPEVEKDTLILAASVINPRCYGSEDGEIRLFNVSGAAPLSVVWQDGSSEFNRNYLQQGNYSVEATDNLGCRAEASFELTQPDSITYHALESPDLENTPNWEGKIMINDIAGGTPPYRVYWPRFYKEADFLEILPEGKYVFTITDAHYCQVTDTAEVSLLLSRFESDGYFSGRIYPNPVSGILHICPSFPAVDYAVGIYDLNGEMIISGRSLSGESAFDLSDVPNGMYFIKVAWDDMEFVTKVIKTGR